MITYISMCRVFYGIFKISNVLSSSSSSSAVLNRKQYSWTCLSDTKISHVVVRCYVSTSYANSEALTGVSSAFWERSDLILYLEEDFCG